MTGPDDKPEDDAAMRAKLDAIAAAIRSHRPAAATEPPAPNPEGDEGFGSAMSLGLQAGSEFVAAIILGGAIGWGLDWLLHTKPCSQSSFFCSASSRACSTSSARLRLKARTLSAIRACLGQSAKDKDVPRGEAPEGATGNEDED